jgi:hypothetical protein
MIGWRKKARTCPAIDYLTTLEKTGYTMIQNLDNCYEQLSKDAPTGTATWVLTTALPQRTAVIESRHGIILTRVVDILAAIGLNYAALGLVADGKTN